MTQGTECKGDWAVAQFDIARLAHDAIRIGDGKVGEAAVVFFKPFRALHVGLARHFSVEVSKLLVELLDLCLHFKVLEGAANGRVGETDGDGSKGARVELWVSLHNVERALRGEGIIVMVDAGNDLALFCIRIGGDGEMQAFDGSMDGFRGWCAREWDGRWIDEGDGGGGEFWSNWLRSNSGLDIVEGGVGFNRGRHVVLVWKC